MQDLISRAALQAAYEKECVGECGICDHVKQNPVGCALIDNAPAVDAVEVVRCKDCMHWQECTQWGNGKCLILSEDPEPMGREHTVYTKADDFCNYGEKNLRCWLDK